MYLIIIGGHEMNNKSKVIIASIVSLGVITGGVLVSGNYTKEEMRRETVIIQEGYESNKINDKNTGEIKVSKIEKVFGESIGWLDDDNILMFYPNGYSDYIKECYFRKYNINTGKEEILCKPEVKGQIAILSPDKNKIFISKNISKDLKVGEGSERKSLSHIYDINTNILTKIDSDATFKTWSEDGSIVGLLKNWEFRNNENTYSSKVIQNELYDVNSSEIYKTIKRDNKNINEFNGEDYSEIELIKDKSTYFVQANDPTSGIAVFQVDGKEKKRKLFNGNINSGKSIDNNILFSGSYKKNVNYEDGLFIYDVENNRIDKLLSGHFPTIKVSEDNEYIAFCSGEDFNELYVARLEDNKIKDKTLVLKSDFITNKIFFSPDGKKLIVRVCDNGLKTYIIHLEY